MSWIQDIILVIIFHGSSLRAREKDWGETRELRNASYEEGRHCVGWSLCERELTIVLLHSGPCIEQMSRRGNMLQEKG